MKLPVYMDYQATTPVDRQVFERMVPYFTERFGNAASRYHEYGWTAEAAVEYAREKVARLIGATPREVIFTSGATESNNLAIFGVAEAMREKGMHIIVSAIEHSSVLDPCIVLETKGYELTVLPVDEFGRVDPEAVRAAIRPGTILVSVMAANNEIGTLQPIADIGAICKEEGVLFHTDAVQAAQCVDLDVEELGVDLLTLSAHKIYGPKGAGAIYVRRRSPRVQIVPRIVGGGHERDLRSGTLNVPAIVGLGEAADLVLKTRESDGRRIGELRDRLWSGLEERLEEVWVNGHPEERLPGNLNVSFGQVDAEALIMNLKDIAVSSGAACASGSGRPSHVLKAIGLTDEEARTSVRFSLGRYTTKEEVDYVIERVTESVLELRALSPLGKEEDRQGASLRGRDPLGNFECETGGNG